MTVDLETLRAFPKVSLHDHLDGALRPQTLLELAAEIGHQLPFDNAEDLGAWFREAAGSGSLERFLETFEHTVAVMQSADNLRRVAGIVGTWRGRVIYGEARGAGAHPRWPRLGGRSRRSGRTGRGVALPRRTSDTPLSDHHPRCAYKPTTTMPSCGAYETTGRVRHRRGPGGFPASAPGLFAYS